MRRTAAAGMGIVAVVALLLALLWRSKGGDDELVAVDEKAPSAARTDDAGQRLPRDSGRQMLAADKASVSGTVRDAEGTPIAGATVCARANFRQLLGAGDRLPKCSKSEHDGHYRLDGLWPVSTAIHASAAQFLPARWTERIEGREREEIRLHAGEERRGIDITLERGGVPVRGVVKDIGGGEIEDALVVAKSGWWGAIDSAFAVARTDAEGRFELWLARGDTSLTAHAEGYAPAETRVSAPTERATIFLTPESVIEGTVVHVESGMPVAGVTVSTSTGGFGSGANEAITDAEGRFRIASLTPGIYNLVARADELYGEGVEQVHLGLGQAVEDVVVEVHPAFAVAGKVVVAETSGPCSEGTVELERVGQSIRAEIDEQGEVLARAVLPGTYEVSVTCPGHVSEKQYEPIVVSDQNLVELEWKVHVGLAIRGVVVDAGGAPVADVSVVASPRAIDGDPRAQLTSSWAEATDKQGNFDLQGLLPGTYELGVWATNQPSVAEPVVVELDKADVEGVRVVLPATGRLVGIVRDESGAAVPGVTITTSSLEQFRPSWGTTRTGDDGRFEIEALAAGDVRVRASSVRAAGTTDDDLQGEVVEIVAGSETQIELTVERRTQGIRGRVLDGSGAPVSDAFVDATRMSDSAAAGSGTQTAMRWGWDRRPQLSDHDGSFEITELAEGDYIVRAYREGGGEGVLEHVAAGSTGVEVVIAGTGELAGKVVLAGGGSPERFDVVASDRAQGLVRRDEFFRTDGGFVLRELVPGNYEVNVTAPEGTAKTEVALAAGQSIDDLTIELVGKITVQGRIVDSDTRAPVPGLRVRVWGTAGSFTGSSNANELEHVTDSDGRFRVEGVSVGKVTVQVTPRNMGTGDSTYSWSRRTINLPSQPAVQDIGDFEVLRSRLAKNERPGDLGYTLARLPPETEPEDRYYEVAVIRPGGPADASGLAIGDRIVEVDGRSVSGADSSYYTLTMAPPGKSIVLGIEGGKQVTIVVGQPVQ